MGFIDYAWSVSLQKDNTKVKMLQDAALNQPILQVDNVGFTIKLPTIQTLPDGNFSYLGHKFPATNAGKTKIGRLFRASVLHLTTHTLAPFPKEKFAPKPSDTIIEAFAKTLVNDVYVNAYLEASYPDRFFDLAYANALAYQKIKSSERIFNPATKVMSALLTKLNTGLIKNSLGAEGDKAVEQIFADLMELKKTFLTAIAADEQAEQQAELERLLDEKAKAIKLLLEPFGPFLEAPSLRHTESLGQCSIYSEVESAPDDFEGLFVQSLTNLGGTVPNLANIEECWRPEQEAESLQAFNSEYYQKQREEKMLSKITPYVSLTRFKDVSFPLEDYTQYLRA